jgi:hypothetical protein
MGRLGKGHRDGWLPLHVARELFRKVSPCPMPTAARTVWSTSGRVKSRWNSIKSANLRRVNEVHGHGEQSHHDRLGIIQIAPAFVFVEEVVRKPRQVGTFDLATVAASVAIEIFTCACALTLLATTRVATPSSKGGRGDAVTLLCVMGLAIASLAYRSSRAGRMLAGLEFGDWSGE